MDEPGVRLTNVELFREDLDHLFGLALSNNLRYEGDPPKHVYSHEVDRRTYGPDVEAEVLQNRSVYNVMGWMF
jgi:hypothetical protein